MGRPHGGFRRVRPGNNGIKRSKADIDGGVIQLLVGKGVEDM
jgi:hypothetical protein